MDFKIQSSDAYTGGVFKSCIKWKRYGYTSQRPGLLAARITGIVKIDGKEIKFLESTPVEIQMEDGSETIYRCTIPRNALPSMRLKSLEVLYMIIVEGYYGAKKDIRSEIFNVYPIGLEPPRKMESMIVHSDMIRIGDEDSTAFGEIVNSLRNKSERSTGTIAEMVEQKTQVLEEFPGFMNKVVERYREEIKGDIYFYVSMEDPKIEEDRHRVTAWNGDDEIAKIEYREYLIEDDMMEIWYKRNIKSTRIILRITEYIDGEISNDEEKVMKEFSSNMCLYKMIPLSIKHDWFTFDCTLFTIKFSYRIEFDGVGFVLPIRKVSLKTRKSIDEL